MKTNQEWNSLVLAINDIASYSTNSKYKKEHIKSYLDQLSIFALSEIINRDVTDWVKEVILTMIKERTP